MSSHSLTALIIKGKSPKKICLVSFFLISPLVQRAVYFFSLQDWCLWIFLMKVLIRQHMKHHSQVKTVIMYISSEQKFIC